METLSYIMLILLSLAGYSAGMTKRARLSESVEPELPDLVTILLIWAAAIFSRITLDLDKWILILFGVGVSFIIGYGISSFRLKKSSPEKEAPPPKTNIWETWKAFSKKMGGFQSRMLLSFIFFTLITPFALVVKIFSDPLHLKKQKSVTHWQEKKNPAVSLEDFKRQS